MRKNIDKLVKLAQSILSIPHLDAKHKRAVAKVIKDMSPAAKVVEGRDIVIAQAKSLYVNRSDDNIEIDSDPVVLVGEDGCLVNAWLYVPNSANKEGC